MNKASFWESRISNHRAKTPQIYLKPRRICCGCQAVLDEGDPSALVTHTFCPTCKKLAEEAIDIAMGVESK